MDLSGRVLTVPNLLTMARLASLPVTVVLFRQHHHAGAALLFAAAMLTDCADGWLAQRLGQRTRLGFYLEGTVSEKGG